MIRSLRTIGLIVLLLTAPSPEAQAQHVVAAEGGAVSVRAVDVSLGTLLRELGALGRFSTFNVGPAADAQRVTLSLDRVPLHVAVVEALKAADVAFVFAGGSGGDAPFRLIAQVLEFVDDKGATAEPSRPVRFHSVPADGRDQEPEAVATADHEAAASTQRSLTEFGHALTATAIPIGALGSVALPFPTPGGAPVMQTVVPKALRSAPPFPVPPTTAAQPPAPPVSLAPAPPDPVMQALERALAPPPR